MALTVTEKRLAPRVLREMRQQERDYAAECEEWARPKFGAPGGYRPHYCIHGTNLWTDYDNICQGCEDGSTLYDMALYEIRRRADVLDKMSNAIQGMRDAHFSHELVTSAEMEWFGQLQKYFP